MEQTPSHVNVCPGSNCVNDSCKKTKKKKKKSDALRRLRVKPELRLTNSLFCTAIFVVFYLTELNWKARYDY